MEDLLNYVAQQDIFKGYVARQSICLKDAGESPVAFAGVSVTQVSAADAAAEAPRPTDVTVPNTVAASGCQQKLFSCFLVPSTAANRHKPAVLCIASPDPQRTVAELKFHFYTSGSDYASAFGWTPYAQWKPLEETIGSQVAYSRCVAGTIITFDRALDARRDGKQYLSPIRVTGATPSDDEESDFAGLVLPNGDTVSKHAVGYVIDRRDTFLPSTPQYVLQWSKSTSSSNMLDHAAAVRTAIHNAQSDTAACYGALGGLVVADASAGADVFANPRLLKTCMCDTSQWMARTIDYVNALQMRHRCPRSPALIVSDSDESLGGAGGGMFGGGDDDDDDDELTGDDRLLCANNDGKGNDRMWDNAVLYSRRPHCAQTSAAGTAVKLSQRSTASIPQQAPSANANPALRVATHVQCHDAMSVDQLRLPKVRQHFLTRTAMPVTVIFIHSGDIPTTSMSAEIDEEDSTSGGGGSGSSSSSTSESSAAEEVGDETVSLLTDIHPLRTAAKLWQVQQAAFSTLYSVQSRVAGELLEPMLRELVHELVCAGADAMRCARCDMTIEQWRATMTNEEAASFTNNASVGAASAGASPQLRALFERWSPYVLDAAIACCTNHACKGIMQRCVDPSLAAPAFNDVGHYPFNDDDDW